MSDNKEQSGRKHKRFKVSFDVEISANQWEDVLELSTDNISRGGLFIRSKEPVEVGARVQISLKLPDDTALKVQGVVIHAVTPKHSEASGGAAGFGVRFDEKHVTDLVLLQAIAASHTAGRNSYSLSDLYMSMPAVLRQAEDRHTIETTSVYHLLGGADSSKEADPSAPASKSLDLIVDVEEPARAPATPEPPPVPRAEPSEPIFGIDLGTTYSSIALVDGDRISLLEDEEGSSLIPSVVCYREDADPLVGWSARKSIATFPTTTFVAPKRLLGRRFKEKAVAPIVNSSSVKLAEGPGGQIVADVFDKPLSIQQVCADLLRYLGTLGERATGKKVRRVVLSAPSSFVRQRPALLRAAELAGLQVAYIVDEPVASAVAYGRGREAEIVAVYDLGGGTFDFTLLEIEDCHFRVLAQTADPWLGGDDFDLAVANQAAELFEQQCKVDLRKQQIEWQRLLRVCEEARCRLSTEHDTEVLAEQIVLTAKGPLDLRMSLSRDRLAALCTEYVDRSIELVSECLQTIGIDPYIVDQVVLTGGACRMPLVREKVAAFFDREVDFCINPEHAVVVGNALYGYHAATVGPLELG